MLTALVILLAIVLVFLLVNKNAAEETARVNTSSWTEIRQASLSRIGTLRGYTKYLVPVGIICIAAFIVPKLFSFIKLFCGSLSERNGEQPESPENNIEQKVVACESKPIRINDEKIKVQDNGLPRLL